MALYADQVVKPMRLRPAHWGWFALSLLLLLFLAYYGTLTVRKVDALVTGVDLADVDQAMWWTVQGQPFRMTTNPDVTSRLGIHVEPVLVALTPLYALLPSAKTLLWIQAVVLALAAVPLYLLAADELGHAWLALIFPALYLLSPAVHNAALSDFYPVTLGVLPATAALVALRRERIRTALVLGGIALLAREDYGLWLAALALVGWWTTRRRIWLIAAGAGLAWFLVATLVIIPAFVGEGQSLFWERYRFWLEGPEAWRAQGFLAEKGRYLLSLLLTGGVSAFLAPLWVVPALPVLVLNLLSNFTLPVSFDSYYSTLIAPTLLVALAIGLGRTGKRWQVLALLFVLGSSLWVHLWEGRSPLVPGFRPPVADAHARALEPVTASVPDGASLSVSPALAPHFSRRPVLNIYPTCQGCDTIVLDILGDRSRHPVDMRNQVSDLLASGWGVAAGQHGFLVLEQGTKADTQIPEGFYTFTSPQGEPQHQAGTVFGDKLELVGFDLLWDYWGRPAVRLYWRALEALELDWQPAALATDRDGTLLATPDTHTPVILLWHPASRWQPGETYVVEMLPFDAPGEVLISVGVGAPLVEPQTRLTTANGQDLVPLVWLERHYRGWRIKPAGANSLGQAPALQRGSKRADAGQAIVLPFAYNPA